MWYILQTDSHVHSVLWNLTPLNSLCYTLVLRQWYKVWAGGRPSHHWWRVQRRAEYKHFMGDRVHYANTRGWRNVGVKLVQRLRRWTNITPTLWEDTTNETILARYHQTLESLNAQYNECPTIENLSPICSIWQYKYINWIRANSLSVRSVNI